MDYPFIRCLYPRIIQNPYTGHGVLVNCRNCAACDNASSRAWSNLCDIESQDHKYTMFLTLTFNNSSVPCIYPLFGEHDTLFSVKDYSLWSRNDFIDSEGFVLSDDKCSHYHNSLYDDYSNVKRLVIKSNIDVVNDCIAVLNKNILQNFFKLFRYYAKQFKIIEKVSYFAVGEYGPIHFRPHFHCLLYFDSNELYGLFRKIVSKAWKYGYFYIENTSNGQASRYVAKYLNSSANLPSILRAKAFRPFRVHSNFFGASYYQKLGKALYVDDYRLLIERVSRICSQEKRVSIWRNLSNCLFPKIRGFCSLNDADLFKSQSSSIHRATLETSIPAPK